MKKKVFIPNEPGWLKKAFEQNSNGELRASPDGKGWIFTPDEKRADGQPNNLRVQLAFIEGQHHQGGKVKAEDPDVALAQADPEFVEAAKFAGLSVEDAVKLTKMFR